MSRPADNRENVQVAAVDLAVSYGGPPVLEDVTFSAPKGMTTAVLGPNGSGKSTLFRSLTGELRPVRGRVLARGRIAYVPQNDRSRLDFPVNAHDVTLMGRYASLPWWHRLSKQERERATAALARVGLADFAQTHYGSLSGGQRRRVLIARALAQDAEVLLMDEPYANVDPASSMQIDELLTELRAEGRTVLITTHDVEQARSLDLVLCLNRRQIAFGRPDQVLSNATLQETYGKELIVLSGETAGKAITVHHHD